MGAMRFDQRMSDMDALMWSIEKDPLLRSTIVAVAILDREPDRARLDAKLERGTRLIPRLRQRAVSTPFNVAPPQWVIDANFDLRYHVRWVKAPGDGSIRALLDLAAPMAMQGFDRARPLWEFAVVTGLADGRAAMIQKVHHSVTDGVGGMELAMMLLDLERDPAAVPDDAPPAAHAERPGPMELFVEGLRHERRRQAGIAQRSVGNVLGALRSPGATAASAVQGAQSLARMLAPAFEPLSPIMKARSLSVHFEALSAPLAEMKLAAKAAGARVNDAFVAGVLGGWARYHEHHGVEVDALRMTMPISIRSASTTTVAGNQFVPARFPVPLTIADPGERMAAVRDLVATQRDEPALAFTEAVAGVLNRMPTMAVTQLFGGMLKGIDFVTSNVPGAPIPVYIAGARVESQFAYGPLSGAAVNLTLMSHLDNIHVGINTDPAAVPDPDVLLRCMEDGFAEVLKVGA